MPYYVIGDNIKGPQGLKQKSCLNYYHNHHSTYTFFFFFVKILFSSLNFI